MSFTTLGLSDRILQGVRTAGYDAPTPIQTLAIPPAMAGRDLIGTAQTGTGKTAAFVLPILHRLESLAPRNGKAARTRALVLTPTRELARQVYESACAYGRFLPLRSTAIFGGVSMHGQLAALRAGVDIVIATPGRLLDHLGSRSIDLSGIAVVVLDEADRMLDMGFLPDVRRILGALPAQRQTLLFSATFPKEIDALAKRMMRDPVTVAVDARHDPVETVDQRFYGTQHARKTDLLLHVLGAEGMERVLVFSRTKHGADKISRALDRHGIASEAIHSNRSQPQRLRTLDGFKSRRFRVLVATDIAARGIDVDGITHVVNFDMPHTAEDYVHRIGRTGRAGASGQSLTFVTPEDAMYIKRLERYLRKRLDASLYPGFAPPHDAIPALAAARDRGYTPSQSVQIAPGNGRVPRPAGARRFGGGRKSAFARGRSR